MKKLISLLLCVTLFALCAACASAPKEVTLSKVSDQIISDLSLENTKNLSADFLLNLYGIKSEDCKQSACFSVESEVFPDEVLMFEAVDADAAARIGEKLQNHLTEVKNQAQNYSAEDFALLQKCEVKTNGTYVTLFISAKSAEMTSVFNSYLK